MNKPIPLNIHLYRRRKGLSQQALADELRIRRESLNRIERGRQYLTEVMELRIVRALDLSPDERNHMLGMPLRTVTSAAERASQPGPESRRLWLVGAPSESETSDSA